MWNKREIEEINTRLQYFRSELALHMTYDIKRSQDQIHTSQASRSDIQELRASVQALECKSYASAEEISRSVAEVRVDNSRFHAQVTQAVPASLGSEASLQHLMRSLLDEYEERLMTGVEKRFRAAARSEMDGFRGSLSHALRKIRFEDEEAIERTVDIEEYERTLTDHTPTIDSRGERLEPHAPRRCDGQSRIRSRKESTSRISNSEWRFDNRLGRLYLRVSRSVIFDDDHPRTYVYSVTMHVVPSARWLTTAFSVTYQSLTDPRGKPKIIIQPETCRVLGRDHDVWRAVMPGDITPLRMMLSQRLVSPSDCDDTGRTLLHVRYCFCSVRSIN